MSQLICKRTIYTVGKDHGKSAEVRLYAPYFSEIEGNWVCPVEFSNLDSVAPLAGRGVDAFQALIVAVGAIGLRLESTNLNWCQFELATPEDNIPADDGFPRYLPSIFGAEFRREVERIVADEVSRAHKDGRDKVYLARAGLFKRKDLGGTAINS